MTKKLLIACLCGHLALFVASDGNLFAAFLVFAMATVLICMLGVIAHLVWEVWKDFWAK